ncbi:uncharacterized protein [Antedon mediterranea]|uniref:uncharacterized protein n=1 Tax=Antedon mediterranea TaxID=105859 RepID=UPI003AF7BB32
MPKIMELCLLIIFVLSFLDGQSVEARRSQEVYQKCQPVTIPMCENLPYNMTTFPNFLKHQSQEEAGAEIAQFLPLVNVECSEDLRFFLCMMYAPPCIQNFVIPPCLNLCEQARYGCEVLMNRFGFSWPEQLSCDKFKEAGPGVLCIDRNRTDDNVSKRPAPVLTTIAPVPVDDVTYCFESSAIVYEDILSEFCKAHFVMKIRLESISSTVQETSYQANDRKREIYKRDGLKKRDLKAMLFHMRNSAAPECCNVMKPGEEFLVMGYKDNKRLIISSVFAWTRSRDFRQTIRKFVDLDYGDVTYRNKYFISHFQSVSFVTRVYGLLRYSRPFKMTIPSNGKMIMFAFIIWMFADTTMAQTSLYGSHTQNPNATQCENITVSICQSQLYNTTILPNLLNHTSQNEAALVLTTFYPLILVECSPDLQDFLCAMYLPPCTDTCYVTPPCKSLCQSSKNGCQDIMDNFGFTWPDELDCNRFPEQTQSVCIDVDLRRRKCMEQSSNETIVSTRHFHRVYSVEWLLCRQVYSFYFIMGSSYLYSFILILFHILTLVDGSVEVDPTEESDVMTTIEPRFGKYKPPNYHQIPDWYVKDKCEPVTVPLCKDRLYNFTIVPNLLDHDSQDDAGLEAHQFYPLVKVGCSEYLQDFLCSMYAPPCTVLEYALPPCKSLCKRARADCEGLMNRYGFKWPTKLDCKYFPKDGLCMGVENLKSTTTEPLMDQTTQATEPTPMSRDNSTFCYESLDGRKDDLKQQFCGADFVMKVRLEEVANTLDGTTYLISGRRRTLYKTHGLIKRDLKTLRLNAKDVVAAECCHVVKPGEDYLILGYKNGKKLVIKTIYAWSKGIRNLVKNFDGVQCSRINVYALKLTKYNYWIHFEARVDCLVKVNKPTTTMFCREDHVKNRRWVKPLSVLVLSLLLHCTTAQVHGPYGNNGGGDTYSKPRCEAITIPLCHQLPYNTTISPNLLNQNQEDAGLEVHQFYPLVKVECSVDLKYFLCSMYAPPCTMVDFAIPPCKSLCQSARNGCEALMNRFGFQWPDKLDCDLFPEQRPGILCVDRNRTTHPIDNDGNGGKTITTKSPENVVTSTPAIHKEDIPFTCPKEFTVPEKDEEFLGSKNCGAPCPMFFTDPAQQKFARLWIGIWAFICAGSSLFTFMTFVIDTKRFRYPERPIIFLSGCYFMIAVVYIVGFFMDDEIACNQPSSEDVHREATLTQGAKKEMCTILFMVLYYFTMASSIWWVLLSLTWFLAAGLKWGHEAIERNSQYFHVAAWSIPAVKTIVILTMGEVDGDPLSGVCFTGGTNIAALRGFVLAPLIIYLIIGTFFLITGFIALCRIRTFMKHENTKTDKLEKLMFRIGIFTVLYTVPATVVVACYIYEQNFRAQWELRWLSDNCLKYSVVCPHLDGLLPEASQGQRPNFTVFMVKYLMLVVVGITSGFWIWSGKTLQSWINFYYKLCSRRRSVPKKPSEV